MLTGFILITMWNLNHEFNWFESMDRVWGIGFAIPFFGSIYHIHSITFGIVKRKITAFFLFVSLANLSDEIFFNPLVVNWYEYATALTALIIINHARGMDD